MIFARVLTAEASHGGGKAAAGPRIVWGEQGCTDTHDREQHAGDERGGGGGQRGDKFASVEDVWPVDGGGTLEAGTTAAATTTTAAAVTANAAGGSYKLIEYPHNPHMVEEELSEPPYLRKVKFHTDCKLTINCCLLLHFLF